MDLTVQDFLDELHRLTPWEDPQPDLPQAELLVGDPRARVRSVGALVDPEPSRLLRASRRFGLILSYHPLQAGLISRLRTDDPAGRAVAGLLERNCALAFCQRRLDGSALGPSRTVADLLRLGGAEPVAQAQWGGLSEEVKLVVFVPTGHEPAIVEAIARGGGGVIGLYSHCTFQSPGTGTYRPLEGASPWAGEVGRLERAEEIRLESRVPRSRLSQTLDLVRAAHPYEEMAYDIYPVEERVSVVSHAAFRGELPRTIQARSLVVRLRRALGARDAVRLEAGDPAARVSRIAICTGRDLDLKEMVARIDVQVLVTDRPDPGLLPAWRGAGLVVVAIDYLALRCAVMRCLMESLASSQRLREAGARSAGVRIRWIA
ncbi:MAG TPA: Nif3-like dinuclear metal center hexameric protein [Sumerlaeia bacterium]|nr:Nif3-like dinuclear metal center hexameric protein [Sumerlaeia bacterium]